MKWEPNIVGYPIKIWQKVDAVPPKEEVPVDTKPAKRPSDNDNIALSDNVMLAHYQRDRR
jgi:hypothetical protein